jgi:hypothetical protein
MRSLWVGLLLAGTEDAGKGGTPDPVEGIRTKTAVAGITLDRKDHRVAEKDI